MDGLMQLMQQETVFFPLLHLIGTEIPPPNLECMLMFCNRQTPGLHRSFLEAIRELSLKISLFGQV